MPQNTLKIFRIYIKALDTFSSKIFHFISSSLFLRLTFAWFIVQALWMAFSTQQGIPPDENYHIGFIKLFTQSGWSPFLTNQEGYYSLGSVAKEPFFLYHYFLSLPSHFFANSVYAIYILRVINVMMGTISLLIIHKTAIALRVSPLVKNLSLFMMGNTLMYIFLSASVNYDNLFILLSTISIFLLILLMKHFTARLFLLLAICVIAGLLTKISFLPIAAVIAIAMMYKFSCTPHISAARFRNSYIKHRTWNIALTIILVFFSALFAQRYVGNIIAYHSYSPSCTQVLTLEQCRESAIFRRGEEFDKLPKPPVTKNLPQYINDWIVLMQDRTYGIFGHRKASPTTTIMVYIQIWTLLMAISFVRHFKKSDRSFILPLTFIAVYLVTLIFENYSTYMHRGIFELAVQGRYWFAVLPLIYVIGNHFILKLLKQSYLKIAYVVITLIIFAFAGLPSYLYITSPDWYTDKSIEINSQIKEFLVYILPI